MYHGMYHGIYYLSGTQTPCCVMVYTMVLLLVYTVFFGIYHGIYRSQSVIYHGISGFDPFLRHGTYQFFGYMAWYASIFWVYSIALDGMYHRVKVGYTYGI